MQIRASAIRLLQFFSTGLIVPVFTLLFLERGLTLSQTSLVIACFSLAAVLLEVPTGILADLTGRKRTFILSVVFSFLAFSVILIIKSFGVLCFGAFLYGAGRALSSGSLDALFIEQYTKANGQEKLPRIISIFSITEAVGLALGSLCGGYLPLLAEARFTGIGKYDLNIIVKLVCMFLLCFLVVLLIREEMPKQRKVNARRHIKESWECVKGSRNLQWMFLSLIAAGVFLNAIELSWQPRFKAILGNDSLLWLLGFLAMLYFGSVLLGNVFCEKIIVRINLGYRQIYIASKLLSGAALFLLALQTRTVLFIAFYMLVYLFAGMGNIPEGMLINTEIADDKRASILSLNSLVFQIGGLLGSLAGSIIVKYCSIPVLWMIAAGIMIISAAAVVKIKEPAKNHVINMEKNPHSVS